MGDRDEKKLESNVVFAANCSSKDLPLALEDRDRNQAKIAAAFALENAC